MYMYYKHTSDIVPIPRLAHDFQRNFLVLVHAELDELNIFFWS